MKWHAIFFRKSFHFPKAGRTARTEAAQECKNEA
jgi:hypothetical protein